MKNIRKIVAILAAALMLCSVMPLGAFAANGDVILDKDFEDGIAGFERGYVENGYMVFDATTADWQNTYLYTNSMKSDTLYKVTFSAKANKEAVLSFKIQNDWNPAHVAEAVDVTTEWQDYELTVNSGTVNPAIVLFTSGYEAGNAPIYYIDNVKIVETVDPALIGKVVNGDFSTTDGWKLGNGATIADGVLKLENIGAWSEAAMQTVPVKANTNYEITWKSQYVSGSGTTYLTLMDAAFDNLKTTSGNIWMNGTSTEWINHSVTLNTGDSEVIIFKATSEDGNAKVINLDDIKITEIKDPSFDGILYNGDFEIGKLGFHTNQSDTLGAWINLWGSNALELVDGYNSDYALKYTGNAWTQVYQPVAVEPNTDYIVTAWAKDASNSALWVKNANGNGDVANQSFAAGSDWQLNVLSFNSGSNSVMWIGLMSLATDGTAVVDNVKVSKAAPVSNDDYLNNTNFEAGSLNSWQLIWDSQVAASIVDDGHDSAFAAKVIGKAPWGQMRQKVTVEANTDYKVTLWAKNVNGMNLLVKDNNDANNITNSGINAGEEWTEITAEFNSGDNTSVYVGVMVNEATSYGTFDDFKMEKIVCEHEYDDCLDADCNLCGETREPGHNLTHFEAVEATNCQETSHDEYWYCENCGCYFGDAEATWQHNPGWLFTPGECVRPEGAADCAIVPCEVCGNDVYGYGEHDVLACQGGTCSKCGDTIEGYGCANYDTPACEDGVCYYCGGFVAGFGHENGAWAPCCDGECAYGCGLIYPAAEDHVDEDGNDYCDNCWSHLACMDEDGDNWCDVCWREMPEEPVVEIIYGDVNGDGFVDIMDAAQLQQRVAGWDVALNEAAADVNGDGFIDIMDAALLQQRVAGWDVTLGPAEDQNLFNDGEIEQW